MSALLLDTHTLLWLLIEPARIPPTLLDRMRYAGTELVVSAASAWEVGTKVRLGTLDGAEALVHGYADHLSRLRARELPIEARHALTAGMLRWSHRDPFDRMIVAQAMIESLPVATADQAITSFPGVTTVWDRAAGTRTP